MANCYPENLVNLYIYVFWSDDDVWYRAKVAKYLEVTKKFKVLYDDKTEEKLDLTRERFLIEDDNFKRQVE